VRSRQSPPPEGFARETKIGSIKRGQLVDVLKIQGTRAQVCAPDGGLWRDGQRTGWASIQSSEGHDLLVREIVWEDARPFPDWGDGPPVDGPAVEGWLEYNLNEDEWKWGYFVVHPDLMKVNSAGTFRSTKTAEGSERSGLLTLHANREVRLSIELHFTRGCI
jgi:hypothetical protein